jgi:SRSO17 transposase
MPVGVRQMPPFRGCQMRMLPCFGESVDFDSFALAAYRFWIGARPDAYCLAVVDRQPAESDNGCEMRRGPRRAFPVIEHGRCWIWYMEMSSSAPVQVVYDGAVTRADLDVWNSDLAELLTRMGPVFYRTESRRHAAQYLRGLLAPIERKNGWTIAEYVGESEPKALQRFLNLSPWDVDLLLKLNRDYILENFASPEAILVADPTGFPKKGTKSVGVQRQYSGTLGRIDNCQIATFLAYVTPARDRVLLDRRLYLPKDSWLADRARCAEAGVPADTTFKTRPEQVIEMIDAARAAGVPFSWFTADEEFGQNKKLREHLQDAGTSYVMAVPKNTTYTDTETRREIQLQHVAVKLNHTAWQRRACGIGTKGFRVYDWALIADADADHQYMIRRSIDDGELAFYHCYNPNRAGFGELVSVAGARWPIEECFGASKNGLY